MSDNYGRSVRDIVAAATLFVVFILTQVSDAPRTLRGDVLWSLAAIALLILLVGPIVLGGRDRRPVFFFVYGCVGGVLFVPLFIPTQREAYVLAMEHGLPSLAEDLSFVAACALGVIAIGIACRMLAIGRYAQAQARAARRAGRTD